MEKETIKRKIIQISAVTIPEKFGFTLIGLSNDGLVFEFIGGNWKMMAGKQRQHKSLQEEGL